MTFPQSELVQINQVFIAESCKSKGNARDTFDNISLLSGVYAQVLLSHPENGKVEASLVGIAHLDGVHEHLAAAIAAQSQVGLGCEVAHKFA